MILYCLNCNALVDAKEIGSYEVEITDEDGYDFTVSYGNDLLRTYQKYTLLKCLRCSNPLLSSLIYNNDFPDYESKPETLYPVSNKIVGSEVSISIKKAFEEALLCFETGAFTACVIMCRKTVEGICKEHNIEKGNLQVKLIAMKNQGIIDQNLFDWADVLRLSGNDAAHDLDVTFSWHDAYDIIDFTYAIIEYIFTYRKKFESFKKRKNNQATKQNNPVPPPSSISSQMLSQNQDSSTSQV